MRTMRMSLMGLLVLALFIGPASVQDAQAGIKVRASVRTPNLRIQVSNRPVDHYRGQRRGHLPARYHDQVRITKQDRRIARRLASYTGVPQRELLQLRRQGYRWNEIGRWLDVPRPVVRAARESRNWQRFVRQTRYHKRGHHDDSRRRLAYHDCDFDD